MLTGRRGCTHKTIESPWTKRKYVIRELDPSILAIFSKPDTPEVKALRKKVQDKLDDIAREEKRQKELGKKDESILKAMKDELQKYYEEIQKVRPLDEKELDNRKKILQYGLVQPKLKSDDDVFDLGVDMTFLWASIISMSNVPDDYAEVIQACFQSQQSNDNRCGKGG